MIDFPRAWQIAKSVDHKDHHEDCSFAITEGGVLCDCDVIFQHPEFKDRAVFYGEDGVVIRVEVIDEK